jgi:hypothetical protein
MVQSPSSSIGSYTVFVGRQFENARSSMAGAAYLLADDDLILKGAVVATSAVGPSTGVSV